jgi:putative transposase
LIFVTKHWCGVPGAEAPEFTGDDDHVHLLAGYQPTVAVSALVNSLQGVPP